MVGFLTRHGVPTLCNAPERDQPPPGQQGPADTKPGLIQLPESALPGSAEPREPCCALLPSVRWHCARQDLPYHRGLGVGLSRHSPKGAEVGGAWLRLGGSPFREKKYQEGRRVSGGSLSSPGILGYLFILYIEGNYSLSICQQQQQKKNTNNHK